METTVSVQPDGPPCIPCSTLWQFQISNIYWSVMHTKRGAIFLSLLGRENIATDIGVQIIFYAHFHHPLNL